MDIVKSLSVFVAVAEEGGFAPAARRLEISTTSASRLIAELESWLGIALFQRTTRRLSLTHEGQEYLDQCRQLLDDLERMRNSAGESRTKPSGTLRLTAPIFLAKECIRPLLPEFLKAYPDVSIELFAVDRFVDLVDEGFDLAIRVGHLPDSTLVARSLGSVRLVIVASPDYIAANGEPTESSELTEHNCIVDRAASFQNRWPMFESNRNKNVPVAGNIAVNDGELARDLAIQGVGLCLLPRFFVTKQLNDGTLVEILKGKVKTEVGFNLAYAQSKHVAPRVRAFIDFVVEYFEQRRERSEQPKAIP